MTISGPSTVQIQFPEKMAKSLITINGKIFSPQLTPPGQGSLDIGIDGDIADKQIIALYDKGLVVGRFQMQVTNRDSYMGLYCPQTSRTGVTIVSTAISGKEYRNDISIVGCPVATVTPPTIPPIKNRDLL